MLQGVVLLWRLALRLELSLSRRSRGTVALPLLLRTRPTSLELGGLVLQLGAQGRWLRVELRALTLQGGIGRVVAMALVRGARSPRHLRRALCLALVLLTRFGLAAQPRLVLRGFERFPLFVHLATDFAKALCLPVFLFTSRRAGVGARCTMPDESCNKSG